MNSSRVLIRPGLCCVRQVLQIRHNLLREGDDCSLRQAGVLSIEDEEVTQAPTLATAVKYHLFRCDLDSQCFAKCPITCQFDWLSNQLSRSFDRLSDHFAKHCG